MNICGLGVAFSHCDLERLFCVVGSYSSSYTRALIMFGEYGSTKPVRDLCAGNITVGPSVETATHLRQFTGINLSSSDGR